MHGHRCDNRLCQRLRREGQRRWEACRRERGLLAAGYHVAADPNLSTTAENGPMHVSNAEPASPMEDALNLPVSWAATGDQAAPGRSHDSEHRT